MYTKLFGFSQIQTYAKYKVYLNASIGNFRSKSFQASTCSMKLWKNEKNSEKLAFTVSHNYIENENEREGGRVGERERETEITTSGRDSRLPSAISPRTWTNIIIMAMPVVMRA